MKELRLVREIAMQILYQWELQGMLYRRHVVVPTFIDNINLENFLGHFLYNFYPKDKSVLDFSKIGELIRGTIMHVVDIDELIDQASDNWKISRMDAIDRALLRLACFEMCIKAKLSPRMVINEAIEIAKRYGGDHSPSFVNAVLDSVCHHKNMK